MCVPYMKSNVSLQDHTFCILKPCMHVKYEQKMYVGVHYKIEKRVNGNRDQKFPLFISNA